MAFEQHVMTCTAAAAAGVPVERVHPDGPRQDCIAIVCSDGAELAWHSHDNASIEPATRLNPDVPAKDYR